MKMSLKQGDLENIILNALWDLESDSHGRIFVADVQHKIRANRANAKEWAYTTVKTVLDRLVDKDIALREKEGKKFAYRSVLQRDEAGLVALSKLIRQYFCNDLQALDTCLEQLRPEFKAPPKPYASSPKATPANTREPSYVG